MTAAGTSIVEEKEFYGVEEYRGLQFFDVHIGADERHAEVGRNFVARYAESPEERQAVRETARSCLDALWSFVDGVNESAHAPEGAE